MRSSVVHKQMQNKGEFKNIKGGRDVCICLLLLPLLPPKLKKSDLSAFYKLEVKSTSLI